MKQHIIFDCELIGSEKPVFLCCTKSVETGEHKSFWLHKRGDMKKLEAMILDPGYTWVSFNGNNFDAPLICAALTGADTVWLKDTAGKMIEDQMKSWQVYREFAIDFIEFDHIDLIEVAPGVMISLKTYAGRMDYPTMVDMPFDHDQDLTPKQQKVLENYCRNDLGVTEALFLKLKNEIKLREELSAEHGIDLRSKSDAQIAEAILKAKAGIGKRRDSPPVSVTYTAPGIIKTKSRDILQLIELLEKAHFTINRGNGSPELPEWLDGEIKVGKGTYQLGLGGLHSTHDRNFYKVATDELDISDFDVASYYPNLMMGCGLIPRLNGNQGMKFMEAYEEIYHQRMEAKHAGNKPVADSLKITLNGTFGKLGSIYSAFYSPDVMLGVTITGQLNLLCLIDRLERIKGVSCYSANTDGVTVGYAPAVRDKVLKVFHDNFKHTGFEYEETPYKCLAMKDVNNYVAITAFDKAKRKGLYAEKGLMKNPTMEVCSDAAITYLNGDQDIENFIRNSRHIEDFVSVRNVKGGGVQHEAVRLVDDWIEVEPGFWEYPGMTTKSVKRKSRPAPREVGYGGTPFGRVARWYMSTQNLLPITYVGSGNKVPKTEGAKLCMTFSGSFMPPDLDYNWYIEETKSMLRDMGVNI